jgi:hypothetical protein
LGVLSSLRAVTRSPHVAPEVAARYAPNDYPVRANLGDATGPSGERGESDRVYRRSIALARAASTELRDAIAHSYAATVSRGEPRRGGGEEMKRAIDLDPKEPSILLDAAVVAALAGRTAEAIGPSQGRQGRLLPGHHRPATGVERLRRDRTSGDHRRAPRRPAFEGETMATAVVP